jgi:hypothetical protein
MQASNVVGDMASAPADDVPPRRHYRSYKEYVERQMRERTLAAYKRGFTQGSRCRLLFLLAGVLCGRLLGIAA